MGAKTWMIVGSDGDASEILRSSPPLDRAASAALARRLFPGEALAPLEDGTLEFTNPPDDELMVGVFPGLAVVAAKEFGIDRPATLPASLRDPALGRTIYLHAMHSVVDWFAFAVWQEGKLVRSLSLSPDDGIIEDIGARLPFELPYWEGRHPALEPEEDPSGYPFVFHPLELGEAALKSFFGYQLEGALDGSELEPASIPLLRYRRSTAKPPSKPWWKLW